MPLGGDGNCVDVYIPAAKDDVQAEWQFLHVASLFFSSARDDKKDARLATAMPEIVETHKKIWPQIEAPNIRRGWQTPSTGGTNVIIEAQLRTRTMPTSLFMATLVWMFMASKRNADQRRAAGMILHQIITRACVLGITFSVLHFAAVDTNLCHWASVSSGDGMLWTNTYADHVGCFWNFDVLDPDKPWITSKYTEPSIADYILFALDPVLVKSKHHKLKMIKAQLIQSALTMVSKLGGFLNANIESFSDSVLKVLAKRRATCVIKQLHWFRAAELLYSQKDPHC